MHTTQCTEHRMCVNKWEVLEAAPAPCSGCSRFHTQGALPSTGWTAGSFWTSWLCSTDYGDGQESGHTLDVCPHHCQVTVSVVILDTGHSRLELLGQLLWPLVLLYMVDQGQVWLVICSYLSAAVEVRSRVQFLSNKMIILHQQLTYNMLYIYIIYIYYIYIYKIYILLIQINIVLYKSTPLQVLSKQYHIDGQKLYFHWL